MIVFDEEKERYYYTRRGKVFIDPALEWCGLCIELESLLEDDEKLYLDARISFDFTDAELLQEPQTIVIATFEKGERETRLSGEKTLNADGLSVKMAEFDEVDERRTVVASLETVVAESAEEFLDVLRRAAALGKEGLDLRFEFVKFSYA